MYCNGPKSIAKLADELISIKPRVEKDNTIHNLCNWIKDTYHQDWSIIKYLQHGIGVHHARLPRSLAQFIVELFNAKKLDILLCTSTIIEGVNTSAKNVVMHEQKIGKNDLDYFTFNNIAGRAGRMFKHFIGNVFIFSDPPQEKLPYVDIPVISQNSDTSINVLLGMDANDLSDSSYNKIAKFYDDTNSFLIDTVKRNPQIAPESQLRLAEDIIKNGKEWHTDLYWDNIPTYSQLSFVCHLIFEYFNGENLAFQSVRSERQLAFLINRLKYKYETKYIIQSSINKDKGTRYESSVDVYISKHLNFIRLWATFHFPNILMCISDIQKEVYQNLGMSFGDYSYYAKSVESLFFDPALICLEEYGIPLEISRKIETEISFEGNLDLTINKLKSIDIQKLALTTFEKYFLAHAIKYI